MTNVRVLKTEVYVDPNAPEMHAVVVTNVLGVITVSLMDMDVGKRVGGIASYSDDMEDAAIRYAKKLANIRPQDSPPTLRIV